MPMGICSKLPASFFSSTLPLPQLQLLAQDRGPTTLLSTAPTGQTLQRLPYTLRIRACWDSKCSNLLAQHLIARCTLFQGTYRRLCETLLPTICFHKSGNVKLQMAFKTLKNANRKGSLKIAQTALSLLPFPTGIIHLLPAYKLGRLWWKSYWQVYLTPFSFPDLGNSGEERANLANGEKKDSWVTDCFGTSLQAMSLPPRDWCLVKDI